MKKLRVVTMDGRPWIEAEIGMEDGDPIRMPICPADWRWRSAQPHDVWVPKRGKHGKTVAYTDVMGRKRTMECGPMVISQHHSGDKSARVLVGEAGTPMMVRWRSLKTHWKPVTERKMPPLGVRSTVSAGLE